MATSAKGGFGTKLYRDDGTGTFVLVAEVGDIAGPDISHVMDDATSMDSPSGWAEKIAVGVKEAGDVTFPMCLLQDDASQNVLYGDIGTGTKRNFRMVFPSGTKRLSFSGFVQSIGHTFPVRQKMVNNVTLTPTGPVVKEAHP